MSDLRVRKKTRMCDEESISRRKKWETLSNSVNEYWNLTTGLGNDEDKGDFDKVLSVGLQWQILVGEN